MQTQDKQDLQKSSRGCALNSTCYFAPHLVRSGDLPPARAWSWEEAPALRGRAAGCETGSPGRGTYAPPVAPRCSHPEVQPPGTNTRARRLRGTNSESAPSCALRERADRGRQRHRRVDEGRAPRCAEPAAPARVTTLRCARGVVRRSIPPPEASLGRGPPSLGRHPASINSPPPKIWSNRTLCSV